MKIFIKAKPKSKKELIKKIDATHYVVSVKEPPINNKANDAILKSLAQYFDLPNSSIDIISGKTTKQKIIEIPLSLEELEKIGKPSAKQMKML